MSPLVNPLPIGFLCSNMSDRNKCSFSIEHILNVAGTTNSSAPSRNLNFDWLSCTRYRPPKLPRPKKEGQARRNSGRNPRIPFSAEQVAVLEETFQRTPYLNSNQVQHLAVNLKLTEVRVKIWFQNRRARERRELDASSNSSAVLDKKQIPHNRDQNEVWHTNQEEKIIQRPLCHYIMQSKVFNDNMHINTDKDSEPAKLFSINKLLPFDDVRQAL